MTLSSFALFAQITSINSFKVIEKSATSITVAWTYSGTQPNEWKIASDVHPVTSYSYLNIGLTDLQDPIIYHLESIQNIQIYVISSLTPNTHYDISVTDTDQTHQATIQNISTYKKLEVTDGFEYNEECCNSYKPIANKQYILSAWVKVDVEAVATYENVGVQIIVKDDNNTEYYSMFFEPEGNIIDGWQRIEGAFRMPKIPDNLLSSSFIDIQLINNDNTYDVYFDDIRIFPKDGNLKSFVYDAATKKLMAELDENNFATFYEYDQEGGLIRIKKETERGVYTIQETRSNTKK